MTTESTNRRTATDVTRRPIESRAVAKGTPSVTEVITVENSCASAPTPRDEMRCIEVSGDSPAESERVSASTIAGKSDSIDSRWLFTSRDNPFSVTYKIAAIENAARAKSDVSFIEKNIAETVSKEIARKIRIICL